jgi:hypothetical protein
MQRHQRERFDVEQETVGRALCPKLRVSFRWQGVVGRIDLGVSYQQSPIMLPADWLFCRLVAARVRAVGSYGTL